MINITVLDGRLRFILYIFLEATQFFIKVKVNVLFYLLKMLLPEKSWIIDFKNELTVTWHAQLLRFNPFTATTSGVP
jgi:hypothetical protein